MIFVTVGTLAPFDRLVRALEELVAGGLVTEDVFAQTGEGGYKPTRFPSSPRLTKTEFEAKVRACSKIVSHAGMGTIIQALTYGKPLLVIPRLRRYREHVNDHQLATAKQFEKAGQVVVAYAVEELQHKLALLGSFKARPRTAEPEAVAERVARFLRDQQASREE